MGQPVIQRAFAAGELDPGLSARADIDRYAQGLRLCRNFLVRRSGGLVSRPGLLHVATPKVPSARCFLYAFRLPGTLDSYLVEAGAFYFRFHHVDRGMVRELATPYLEEELYGSTPLVWHQSGLTVTLTHLNHGPMDLTYTGPDTFTLTPTDTAGGTTPPTPVGVPSITNLAGIVLDDGAYMQRWAVTAVDAEGQESLMRPFTDYPPAERPQAFTLRPTPAAPLTLTFSAVPEATEYRVYRDDNESGTFGYIGTATGQTTFKDIGVDADPAFRPPSSLDPPTPPLFVPGPMQYPATSVMHDQRRVYGGTWTYRDVVYASRIALPHNFTVRSPIQDDDALSFRIVSQDVQAIVALVNLGPLIILTDRGEWVCEGDESGAMTPTLINAKQKGYVGAAYVPPVVYGERLLFVQARATALRELRFDQQVEGLSGKDLTVWAAHLFRDHLLHALAFALIPDAIIWAVRDDGVLLGCTYIPEDDVLAWHQHTTDAGRFESLVVLPEFTEDGVYVVVERDGQRTIERLGLCPTPATRRDPALTLDRAVRLRPTSTTLEGLAHLRGRAVRVCLDGVPWPHALTVSPEGRLVLPRPADIVDIGVPIVADLETLELDTPASDVRDRRKKMTALAILVQNSAVNFRAGPDEDHLRPVQAAPWAASSGFTGRIELAPTSYFNDEGRVFLRHDAPTRLTVLGLLPTVDVGG